MKFNIKSKLGFTLIELLVVIGILAVLAAIAIPSVAGLIDRANVSADNTNANEMTNAVERFTSEYELYCQDIASGRIKTGDLDSAQGRVFNVTGADSREDIELLESTGLDGKQINRDTKYPANVETMQALVENYMKTSSTTFTPKQSDCHYYYSPDCGVVVCTETAKSSTTDLNKLIQSGKDAKGNTLGDTTQWIDLTANTSANSGTSIDISTVDPVLENNSWETIQAVAKANKVAETGWSIGDTKSVEINGTEYDATIIGINHEGENGITFMIMSEGGIGTHAMKSNATNEGGWEASDMRAWLNGDIYNSMSNKGQIKEVVKETTTEYRGNSTTETSDRVFLLSTNEMGITCPSWYSEYKTGFNAEGTPYDWFTNNTMSGKMWLRSMNVSGSNYFMLYYSLSPTFVTNGAPASNFNVCPAFVIG